MHVYFKRRFYYQAQTTFVRSAPETVTESRWHQPWSEPVRRKPFLFQISGNYTTLRDVSPSFAWWVSLSQHPGPKRGLKPELQQFHSWPPRMLPPVDITGIMSVSEVNTDEFLAAINGVESLPPVRAKVSIVEVPVEDSAAASISES